VSDGSHLLVWAPTACPKCGARTVDEAETRCRPTSDETGEYYCPGGDREDEQGRILLPTPESVDAMDAWIAEEMKREGW
jgi:hypothetical protein